MLRKINQEIKIRCRTTENLNDNQLFGNNMVLT